MKKWRHSKLLIGLITSLVLLVMVGTSVRAAAGDTTRVSVASDGTQGNGESDSYLSSISADGRYVAFASEASNLVNADTNSSSDIFVHDRQTGQTERVSVASDGTEGNNSSYNPSISDDGRFVAFSSHASNLVSGDTNDSMDVFVHDRQTGQTERVSVTSNGAQTSYAVSPSISADGRYVAFESPASDLVSGDTNNTYDIFVHDRHTGQTTRVSVASDGTEANAQCNGASISANGRYVAFYSDATNLVSGDTNGIYTMDVFVHDLQTGQTTRVSVASDGTQGNSGSALPSISADGRYVVFYSTASNLVSSDTNSVGDIFVHDMQTGATTRVSVDSNGVEGNSSSYASAISADGRYVVFDSLASNLVSGDTNGNSTDDVFVHDLQTGLTALVSVASDGTQENGGAAFPSISAAGSYVAFYSYANNLVSGDTNNVSDVFVRELGGGLPTYSISGRVTDGIGNGISGVSVSVDGGLITSTDSTGNYTLGILAAGSYSITASMPGHKFWPPSRTVSLASSNATEQNFSEWIYAVNAPLYLQTDPAWNLPNQFYDGTTNTIGYVGCALSSYAMILSYYGQSYLPPFQPNPGTLNNDLINFPNGFKGHIIEPITLQSYAWSKGVFLTQAGIGHDNATDRQKLDQYLSSGNPAILRLVAPYSPSNLHFVVVTGKTIINGQSTYTLNDPYYGYATLLDKRYSDHFQSVFYYFTALAPLTYHRNLEISAHSPVQLLVTDAQGRRVGYDPRTDESYNEIPDAGYVTGAIAGTDGSTLPEEKYVIIPDPISGPYSMQVIGDGSGPYSIDVLQPDSSGNTVLANETGTAQTNSVDTYDIELPNFLFLPIISR